MFQHFWGTGKILKPGNFFGSLVASLWCFQLVNLPGVRASNRKRPLSGTCPTWNTPKSAKGSLIQWYTVGPETLVPPDHHGHWGIWQAFNSARTGLTTLDNSWKRSDTHLLLSNISNVFALIRWWLLKQNLHFSPQVGCFFPQKYVRFKTKIHLCKFPRPCSPGWSVRSSNSNHQSSTL